MLAYSSGLRGLSTKQLDLKGCKGSNPLANAIEKIIGLYMGTGKVSFYTETVGGLVDTWIGGNMAVTITLIICLTLVIIVGISNDKS